MNFLMIGVFAFFGLHTSLWLTRSLIEVGKARRQREGPQEGPGGEDEGRGEGPRDA
jgi:hypothetical protein